MSSPSAPPPGPRAGGGPLPVDVASLRRLEERGELPRFLFFWGHRPDRDGRPGRGCLSQWWPAPFTVGGAGYPTAEHFMMAAKARLFGDEDAAARILQARTPGEAKALGRAVRGYDEDRWTAHRFGIVVDGSVAKFGQHPDLLAFLAATTGRVLVEASPLDRVWGTGLAAADPRAALPSQWPGLNLLGFALMAARDHLTG